MKPPRAGNNIHELHLPTAVLYNLTLDHIRLLQDGIANVLNCVSHCPFKDVFDSTVKEGGEE